MNKILKSWWPAFIALALIVFPSAKSQSQTGQVPDRELSQLITEISAQQAVMIANHEKIDAKILEIEENVRQARIFASRSGRPGGTD